MQIISQTKTLPGLPRLSPRPPGRGCSWRCWCFPCGEESLQPVKDPAARLLQPARARADSGPGLWAPGDLLSYPLSRLLSRLLSAAPPRTTRRRPVSGPCPPGPRCLPSQTSLERRERREPPASRPWCLQEFSQGESPSLCHPPLLSKPRTPQCQSFSRWRTDWSCSRKK